MRSTTTGDLRPEVQRGLQMARRNEDLCNLYDLDALVMFFSIDCQWRYETDYIWGREQMRAFLETRWRKHLERRVIVELWAAEEDRIAVRYLTEFHDDQGLWRRAHGCENWQLDASGLVRRRFTGSNDHPIAEHERVLRWPSGVRPHDHPGLSDLSL